MSVHDSSLNPRTNTNAVDSDNKPIKLIDTTKAAEHSDSENENTRLSTDSGWKRLAKKPTNFSVREELARRKYAKWQPDKRTESESGSEPRQATSNEPNATSSQNAPEPVTPSDAQVQEADFGNSTNLQERGRSLTQRAETKRAKARKHPHEPASEIDILYENQRGVFFFGVPLYSHSSLLNFDPAPWVTSSFKDSPVNITNAQVPDPSWEWVWKSWYVDMSYDVDEEGWQYSFSFAKKFSWHGTHPWFHSFVRRRRWLRKRNKRHEKKAEGAMSAAHMLTSEYFTIHPKRERSLSTSRGGDASARYSFISQGTGQENIVPDEITDVASLLKSLRLATIDREKLDAAKKFVTTASDELTLLHEHIPTIMSFFVFQDSGHQLVTFLRESIDQDSKTSETKDARPESSNNAKSRVDSLRKALTAAEKQIGGLEYWSEKTRSHSLLHTTDEQEPGEKSKENQPPESDPVGKIQGIPEKADVGVDFTRGAAGSGSPTSPTSFSQDQEQKLPDGAGKEYEKKDNGSKTDEKGGKDEGESPSISKEIGDQGEKARKETLVVPD